MDSNRKIFLVCYDVSDQKRLARVRKLMLGFGESLQFSVFRCVLTSSEVVTLKQRLGEEINAREDRVLFADLGRGEDTVVFLGCDGKVDAERKAVVV